MTAQNLHSFHIPVMGLGYTVDTPLKVSRYGIASVISIIEDQLLEKMRRFHCGEIGVEYVAIPNTAEDYRAKRITAYLNLVQAGVKKQVLALKQLPFEQGSDIEKYFDLLPENTSLKQSYQLMMKMADGDEKNQAQHILREQITAGAIDVNIMAKVDKLNYTKDGQPLPSEYSDALAALRGFAHSDLDSSVVLSAGYNPRLYSYIATFADFFPSPAGRLKKKIILKVSDYRSALIQGRLLAKKGIWISEFRIESGLNCGGHAFATDGLLLGPILEEFKTRKAEIEHELFAMCNAALAEKCVPVFPSLPSLKITVQGGIGTASENNFLLDYYQVHATGWGSPFLLVPEATNVDEETLQQLATASREDYFLSNASPLGVPFNNFRKSSSEVQRVKRIDKKRPGSPCYKKHLSSDTEFTTLPICTASREYQHLKIRQLEEKNLPAEAYQQEFNHITEKDCLCEGLGTGALKKNALPLNHALEAVTICPGPNLAFFSGIFSLRQMVDHIYGRIVILNSLKRPHMFMNELALYVAHLKKEIAKNADGKKARQLVLFRNNLLNGMAYYKALLPELKQETAACIREFKNDLSAFENTVASILVPAVKTTGA